MAPAQHPAPRRTICFCARGGFKPPTKVAFDRSKTNLEKAVQIDPEFAMAWVRLGWNQVVAAYSGWTDSPTAAWDKAIAYANHALGD